MRDGEAVQCEGTSDEGREVGAREDAGASEVVDVKPWDWKLTIRTRTQSS